MSTRKGRYGDGSITLRKDGRYCARYKGKSVYAKTEAEAVAKLRDLRNAVDNAALPPIRRKLDDYFKAWLESDRKAVWKPSTYDSAGQTYRLYVKEPLGGLQLGQIETKDIQRLLDSKADEGLSYSTARHIYVLLKGLFSYAYEVGDIQKNPIDRVRKPRKKDFAKARQIEALEPDEVAKLEAVAALRKENGQPKNKHANLIIFMLHAGLRKGELLALKWENVDFEKKVLHVVGNYQLCSNPDYSEGAPKRIGVLGDTKSESGERTIPLNRKAIAALRQYEKDWSRSSEFIAVTASGKHINPYNLPETLKRMAKEAGIEKAVHLHMLRHTFASRLLSPEIGGDVGTVSKWLGHAKITTTYNIYVHVLKSTESRAADLLEAL